MLKESIKSPIFTDGFRLIDLLCQSYPPHCVVLRLELSEWLWKKSHREQPIVRLAMCERSSLGLPHTQNRMSGRPRVAEILLIRSPKTLRVRGDLKTRPKFVGSDSSFFGSWSLEGIWNALPNSRGVVKTNLIKALLENRGCRWISNSNSEVKR